MKIRSRFTLAALTFLFAVGSGVAVAAGGGQACLNACKADHAACLKDAVGGGKSFCVAQYSQCKASCGA